MAQPSFLHQEWSLRQASLGDLDAMVEIGLAAMPLDPQWNYRFPYRQEYPEETREFTRLRFRTFLENSDGHWQVMLAEKPDVASLCRPQPVAFAVWEIFNVKRATSKLRSEAQQTNSAKTDLQPCRPHFTNRLNRRKTLEHLCTFRRDGNPERIRAWSETMGRSKKILFDHQFGTKHFHLQILATHPDHQRRGAGASLCSWGVMLAKRSEMAITLFASPMGKLLYEHLDFCSVASVTVKAEDEDESVTLTAMVYRPKSPTSLRFKKARNTEKTSPVCCK